MENAKITNLYNLDETIAKEYLSQFTYPWEALAGISDFIKEIGPHSTLKSMRKEEKISG